MANVAETLRAIAQLSRITDPLWIGGQLRNNEDMKAACESGAKAWEIVQRLAKLNLLVTNPGAEIDLIREARSLVSREERE